MIAPARVAAFETLQRVSAGSADLGAAIVQARSRLDDERDRALAVEIAVGTLRWQGAFDAIITAYAGRAIPRLDPEILTVLRLSAFQLLHLDRIPASAAVNDAVQLARRAGKSSATGLVNAVLRRIARERNHLPLPGRPVDITKREAVLDYLSITLSHPRWLAARWLDRVGFEAAEAWMRFNNAPAGLTVRANRLRTTRDTAMAELAAHGVATSPARFAPDGLIVARGNPLVTPLAGTGLFVVQDEASQLVAVLAGARPGELILDACASPGGKTTALAAYAGESGFVAAVDVRDHRIELLVRTIRQCGAFRVAVIQADAAFGLPFNARFDCVLLDAPCSGLGTIRRDPDIKWRRTENDLPALARKQAAMLMHASAAVRSGGRLIYSTCSSEPEENDVVVEEFLARHPDYRPADASDLPTPVQPFLDSTGRFRTVPFWDQLEAFFGAVLVKA